MRSRRWWGISKEKAPSGWPATSEDESEISREPTFARGYFVSTVGRDEETVREYIRKQEHEDRKYDQMGLFGNENTED